MYSEQRHLTTMFDH